MFAFFKRSPKNVDAAFRDLAEMLRRDERRPTYRVELLKDAALDYSVDSLTSIEDYLRSIRGDDIDDQSRAVLCLRCGAYVGETIRRNSKAEHHWLRFRDAARMSPTVASLGESVWTSGVLWRVPDGYSFPISKVGKFLVEGDEDSPAFFAKTLLSRDWPQPSAK